MLTVILAFFVVLAIYYYLNLNADFFEKRNVKFSRGIPGFGFALDSLFKKKHMMYSFQELYKQFAGQKIFGIFQFHQPVFMITDLELIKQITVKDFDHFMNHQMQIDENVDRLFSRSLFIMRDQKWRDMRATLSPAFTGSKMRLMFKLVMEVALDNMTFLKSQMKDNFVDVELGDLMPRYANDVIAKCAFGISINSMKERDNEFFKMGSKFIQLSRSMQFKFFLYSAFPKLSKFLRIPMMDDATCNFFDDLVMSSMQYREKNNIVIHDMINILMQARKDGTIQVEDDTKFRDAGFATVEESDNIAKTATKITRWTDDELTAQSMIFFLAGFDTVSTAMNFIVHLLAVNPDVQEKLIQEIDDLNEEIDGKLPTYENVQAMEYMDMVVSECLRMWTPAIAIDRLCNKPIVIENTDGTKVQINAGERVMIPVQAIHFDEKYFPNPQVFDPERFSKENRNNILPYTYSPFGIGPRNCIGSRFALMECKAIVFSLLSNFHIEKNEKTVDPVVLQPGSFNLRSKDGFHVRFRGRK